MNIRDIIVNTVNHTGAAGSERHHKLHTQTGSVFLHNSLALFFVSWPSCEGASVPVEKNQHMLIRYVLKNGSWFELVYPGP